MNLPATVPTPIELGGVRRFERTCELAAGRCSGAGRRRSSSFIRAKPRNHAESGNTREHTNALVLITNL